MDTQNLGVDMFTMVILSCLMILVTTITELLYHTFSVPFLKKDKYKKVLLLITFLTILILVDALIAQQHFYKE